MEYDLTPEEQAEFDAFMQDVYGDTFPDYEDEDIDAMEREFHMCSDRD